jgi:hypothetical protein
VDANQVGGVDGAPTPAVAPGVVGIESVGVIVGDAAVVGQPASSWLVLVPTPFRVCSSLSVWSSFAIEPSER